ncbi:MAG: 50S ribosomal protein L21 [Anaerolineales bacterium]|nr:50S ribosomal protein L21 [Anaerolineales bacterium]QYK51602.1 MAG: 50S ribosomal protein L21 [Anaerolineales bacterium]
MRYAIIESGGKQYKAVEGETIEVDLIAEETGKQIEIGQVLLVSDGDNILVGTPAVAGATVAATVVDDTAGPKIVVFKYKPKIRYRVRTGHRQKLTRLMIDSIDIAGETRNKPAKQEAAPKAAAKRKPAKKAATKTAAKKTATKKTAAKKTAKKK